MPFILPGKRDVEWELIIDTSEDDGFLGVSKYYASSSPFDLGPRSLGVFGLHEGTDAHARAEAWQTAARAASDNAEGKIKTTIIEDSGRGPIRHRKTNH